MNITFRNPKHWLPATIICMAVCCCCRTATAQCPGARALWDQLIRIEGTPDAVLSKPQKLKQVLALKQQFEVCRLSPDSVYARILHRIGVYEYYTTGELDKSIANTLQSIAINRSGRKDACLSFAVKSYLNLGYYYSDLVFYDEALRYLDSAAILAATIPGQESRLLEARQVRSNIFSKKGDLQQCAEEATRGLQIARDLHDTTSIVVFLNQRAYTYARQKLYPEAAADAESALAFSTRTHDKDGTAGSLKAKAVIMESTGRFPEALALYKETIRYRAASDDPVILAEDYLDAGNLLLYQMGKYTDALNYFRETIRISLPRKDVNTVASIYNGLGSFDFYHGNYSGALSNYQRSLDYLSIPAGANALVNPASAELARVQNKQILLYLFGNKTECLLHLYQTTRRQDYLSACLRTALLTDSLISAMRHEQAGEQSKLYWRNHTREFFGIALEACWLAKDTGLCFYFMEKSRAVLLNDKWNELGAFAFLPPAAAGREQDLQLKIIMQQQSLAQLTADSPGYPALQSKFLLAKDEQERYIKTLEQSAPAYYQYKYADDVPALDSFRRYLAVNEQSFVDYFVNDTAIYMLSLSPGRTKLIKLPYQNCRDKMDGFVRLCADKQYLNAHYGAFIALSHQLYQCLVEPLGLQKGRVVICPDDFLIPFEALCVDTAGSHFLLYDHALSYVYSARYLMKRLTNPKADGNFLGIAPATFEAYLRVPDLRQSVSSIRAAASWYPVGKLVTGKKASRTFFFEEASNYAVVNIYSHARADSTDNEPVLFMSDSVIHLSELQLLPHPAAQLVVLTACQTGAGKSAAGEGIYSLARGFASAGIPAVASTIWKADELSIYRITENFDRNLARGMPKDEALRQSKLELIQANDDQRLLPYYWANMVLVGNAGPVNLTTVSGPNFFLFVFLAALAGIGCYVARSIYRARRT